MARVQMKEGDEGLQWSTSNATRDKVRHSCVCVLGEGAGMGGAGVC